MKIKLISALMIGTLISASAQKQNDPYKKKTSNLEKDKIELTDNNKNNISYDLVQEVFLVSKKELAALLKKAVSDVEIYQHVSTKNKLDSITTMRLLPGQRSTSASAKEVIYPTEHEAFRSSANKDKGGADTIGVLPLAFQTRHTGLSLESEIMLEDNGSILVRVRLEDCQYLGDKSWGEGKGVVRMPEFHSQSIRTEVTVEPNKPSLLGTLKPKETVDKSSSSDMVRVVMITVKKVVQ